MPVVDRRPGFARYLTSEGALPFAVKADNYDTGWTHGGRGGLRLPSPFTVAQVTGHHGLRDFHKEWLRDPAGDLRRVVVISEKGRTNHLDEALVIMPARMFTILTGLIYKEGAEA